jgi:hypothetical protein
MKTYTQDELRQILYDHAIWRQSSLNGKRANLSGANLSRADLSKANLSWADLSGANLNGAYLGEANLGEANLSEANLSEANLSWANLSWANLSWANLSRANLNGATGNMQEVKSAQFDTWAITWTRSHDNVTELRIGCQAHDLEKWRIADPQWIAAMTPKGTRWWAKYGSIILALVDASPAVPYGTATLATTEQSQCQPS